MRTEFPPATARPCNECPWRRIATPGHLGPHSPEAWERMAHSETVVACHRTIGRSDDEGMGDWDDPGIRQCRGMAQFRANVHKKPRLESVAIGPPDPEDIFSEGREFIDHHRRTNMRIERRATLSGTTDELVEMLEGAIKELTADKNAQVYVEGNGADENNLVIDLQADDTPHPEEADLGVMVDWDENPV